MRLRYSERVHQGSPQSSSASRGSGAAVSQPRHRGRSGGAATAGGVDFQSRLAAWVATAVLAETHAPPLWDWPEASSFHSVYAETGEAVDDLLVTNSLGARAYVQAKLRLDLSEDAESPLASALGQFVDQWLGDSRTSEDDRLVLATGPESSGAIRDVLPWDPDAAAAATHGRCAE